MRIALVHHWLVRMRGGEKVLEALAELYPRADVFTLVCDRTRLSPALARRRIRTSWLDRVPFARRLYGRMLPLHPLAVRSLDLDGYDLVISSDGALVKGVSVPRGALHICYCHTPPRYLWDLEETYLRDAGAVTRAAARVTFPYLRRFDRRAARRVDFFVANSEHVRARVRRHYGRDAAVVYPPVAAADTPEAPGAAGAPETGPPPGGERPYLYLGSLVPYKRADLAVEAANRLARPLVVIGEGPERRRLERLAGPSVTFTGWLDDAEVARRLRSCRALLFPGEEDFGMVPVEAMAAGRPVVALGAGGARETVVDGATGLFFRRRTPEAMADAILEFERVEPRFSPEAIRRHASRFAKPVFMRAFGEFVRARLAERRRMR